MSKIIRCDFCGVELDEISNPHTQAKKYAHIRLTSSGVYPSHNLGKDVCSDCCKTFGISLDKDAPVATPEEQLFELFREIAAEAVDDALAK